MATVQRQPGARVIVFYEKEQRSQLERLLKVFPVFDALTFPIDEEALAGSIDRAIVEAA